MTPIFNREKYIADCVESILNLEFQDWELVLVDDCSTDGSAEIAKKYAALDSRVSLKINEKNIGQFANRNQAADMARGKYLKYLDSDDLIYSHSLSIMVEAMEKYPDAALGLCHSLPEIESPYPLQLSAEQSYQNHFLGRGCLGCGPSGAIMRRDCFEKVAGFDPSWGVLADTELWYRMAARWPVVLLQPGLVWWRRHADQEFTKDDAEFTYLHRGLESEMNALKAHQCPLSENDREQARVRSRQHFARRVLSLLIKRRNFSLARKVFQQSDLTYRELAKGFFSYQ